MKKYFTTSILLVTICSMSLLSCKKDVLGTNSVSKVNAGNESNMGKKPVGPIILDTAVVKGR